MWKYRIGRIYLPPKSLFELRDRTHYKKYFKKRWEKAWHYRKVFV